MGYCANCGTLISAGWTFCPACGAAGRPDVCPDCGRILKDEWTFCPSCGARIEAPGEGPAVDPTQAGTETADEEPEAPAPGRGAEPEAEDGENPAPGPESGERFETEDDGEPSHGTEAEEQCPAGPHSEPELRPEEQEYAGLIEKRDSLREELRQLDARLTELNGMDGETVKLSGEDRARISEERREIRTAQGRCHSQLLQIARTLRSIAEQEASRGRAIFSREHPEVDCPMCANKLRRGMDTWPYCPYCGENVTEKEPTPGGTALLKLRCGESGIKRVWYTGDADFCEFWSELRAKHRRHEYRYSAGRAVLTAEGDAKRETAPISAMPDELAPMLVILRRAPAGEEEAESADGMRTQRLGALDMTDLDEEERFAFLRRLQTVEPNAEYRKFDLNK